MGRQIDAEANHVHHFLGELRILRELEGADAVRLKAMRLPDALDRAQADAGGFGHRPPGPMCDLARWFAKGEVDHTLDDLRRQGRLARLPRLVAQEAFDGLVHETLLPGPDDRL